MFIMQFWGRDSQVIVEEEKSLIVFDRGSVMYFWPLGASITGKVLLLDYSVTSWRPTPTHLSLYALVTAGTLLSYGKETSKLSLLVSSFRMSLWIPVFPTTFSGWCCDYSTLNNPQSNGRSQGYLQNAQEGIKVRFCRAMKEVGGATFLKDGDLVL
jgi:hypothetical protein